MVFFCLEYQDNNECKYWVNSNHRRRPLRCRWELWKNLGSGPLAKILGFFISFCLFEQFSVSSLYKNLRKQILIIIFCIIMLSRLSNKYFIIKKRAAEFSLQMDLDSSRTHTTCGPTQQTLWRVLLLFPSHFHLLLGLFSFLWDTRWWPCLPGALYYK